MLQFDTLLNALQRGDVARLRSPELQFESLQFDTLHKALYGRDVAPQRSRKTRTDVMQVDTLFNDLQGGAAAHLCTHNKTYFK